MVLDQSKVDNQKHRVSDIAVLKAKYEHLLPQIKAQFDKTAHFFGPQVVG
jgi:hypothetical protein